ncbi:PfkB family carbohydrate kinase [Paenibacillus sp. sgz302251]|uniref:PfkB family carbohydrate kinase n=1 Tax=Paenibacillus sp. sgz302251 TaxID=3414493 RepID=UPI003C7AC1E0
MEAVALGELLIDFMPHGESGKGQPLFECNPGGAPANVLAALAKLGHKTALVGAVGNDAFGEFLRDTLRGGGVDVGHLKGTDEAQTTLAFVHLDPGGDRSFTFYRKPGADYMLRSEDVDRELIASANIFHFGSISMTHEPARTATLETAAYAREMGVLVSYDPNLRMSLWHDAEHAREAIVEGMRYADVVKLSEEELLFLTGTDDLDEGSRRLMGRFGDIRLLLVTLGPDGSYCRTVATAGDGGLTARHAGFKVRTVDTTGSGDAFFGGVLHKLLGEMKGLAQTWTEEKLLGMLAFANAMGALTATGKGAIPSLPTLEQAETLATKWNEQGV